MDIKLIKIKDIMLEMKENVSRNMLEKYAKDRFSKWRANEDILKTIEGKIISIFSTCGVM